MVGGWGGTSERERMEKSIIVKSVSIHMFADLASETEKNCSHSARKQREMLQTTVQFKKVLKASASEKVCEQRVPITCLSMCGPPVQLHRRNQYALPSETSPCV